MSRARCRGFRNCNARCKATRPQRPRSPTFRCSTTPTAGSTESSFFSRPPPRTTQAVPTASQSIAVTNPAWALRHFQRRARARQPRRDRPPRAHLRPATPPSGGISPAPCRMQSIQPQDLVPAPRFRPLPRDGTSTPPVPGTARADLPDPPPRSTSITSSTSSAFPAFSPSG